MVPFLQYIGDSIKGKVVHFKCNCIVPLDITGKCTGYTILGNEVVFDVCVGTKTIKVGSNTPKLTIEIL